MRWRGRRQSSNIEDRRGTRAGGRGGISGGTHRPVRIPLGRRGGPGSLLVIAIILIGALVFGVDPSALLGGGGSQQSFEQSAPRGELAQNDERSQFIATVLAETEDVWNGIFAADGQDYPEPTLVLFEDQVQSACGFASAASGPFYCPADSRVYIDLRFFDELARRFNASGDFAQAYVIAHEVGHHVQNIIGVLPRFHQMRRQMSQAEQNAMSVRVELQADCFAGIWGHFTEQRGLLERGDLQEALNAATQIGDDTIQRRTQGFIVPESFSHGTAEQRRAWFARGFETGRLDACDTFSGRV